MVEFGARLGDDMTEVLIGLGGGVLLGLRWKIAILLPTIVAVVVMMICVGGLSWSNLGHVVLATVAIQAGYFCGVAMQPIAGALRLAKGWRATLRR
jgi:hypothetical protein